MPKQDIAQLKIKRGQVKAQLTRIRNFLEDYEDVSPLPIQARLQKTETLWDKFDEVQSEIECQLPDEATNERTEFENSYFATIAQLNQAIINLSVSEQSKVSESMGENGQKYQRKLPTLQIPTFTGNYEMWLNFKDSFLTIIENNPSLSNLEKFQYLRSSIKGEALRVIQALQCTGENYRTAWGLLTKRYENKRLIINTHVNALFELTSTFKENHTTLRSFIDITRNHVASLRALEEQVDSWNTIIIYLLNSKLDVRISKDWEEKLNSRPREKINDMPTLEEYLEFLEGRCHTLEMTDRNRHQKYEKKVTLASVLSERRTQSRNCSYCNQSHSIYSCQEFIKLPTLNRTEEVKKKHLCLNCLKPGHGVAQCRSVSCKRCNKRHHSLLHRDYNTYPTKSEENYSQKKTNYIANNSNETRDSTSSIQDSIVSTHSIQQKQAQILLSTAEVFVYDKSGNLQTCRALLDSGSQSNFMTQELCKKLNLKSSQIYLPVLGINETTTKITTCANAMIKSCQNDFSHKLNCLIVPNITSQLPQCKIDITKLNIPANVKLADTNFNVPGKIELLIGAELFWELLYPNKIKLHKGQPILQKTKLGWIISGPIYDKGVKTTACYISANCSLEKQLEKFWTTEEIIEKRHLSQEEEKCEEYFHKTTSRDAEGRYIVSLPKRDSLQLGDSFETANKRLHSLENRFAKDSDLKTRYQEFMKEYQALGHMTLVTNKINKKYENTYYLPHHPVIRDQSLTTKLRVVFNGSSKTTSGASLNDLLLVGPTIQSDLVHILLNFRTYQYVLTADISMMYRQIRIQDEDKGLQRICWRNETTEEIQIFHLNTVTYGTSSAPFLATRCLAQLAKDEGYKFPLAEPALKNDFYMDDLLTGCSTKEKTIKLRHELTELLSLGKFPLRKWRSNDPSILQDLQETSSDSLMVLNKEEAIKTLGLLWNANSDNIEYKVTLKDCSQITKRKILSQIASIFDPLGILGPLITSSKIIMQDLWKQKLEWDEPVPNFIRKLWLTFYNDLLHINHVQIPRNINPNNSAETFDIHGFCDASEKAFGAAIYAVSTDQQGQVHSHLLCSKARVAPLKSLSLPRLELNGALLLCKLTALIKNALKNKINQIYHWTDSTIVLTWVKTPPYLLKTFVSNRVAEIQKLAQDIPWYHVPSNQNPADVLSRGTSAEILKSNNLWWMGPEYLHSNNNWPNQSQEMLQEKELEFKTMPNISLTATHNQELNLILTKFSSFQKLKAVLAYCKRFVYNVKNKKYRKTGPLTVEELNETINFIIEKIQHSSFAEDIRNLKNKRPLSKQSKLIHLNPYLDKNELIRVGGRLENANISIDRKHPIILPSDHIVTQLIIEEEHKRLLHGGHEQVLSSIRQKYWPISARRLIKKVTRNCLKCFRLNPIKSQHLMGNLPVERICSSSRPFISVGIDYAGPIQIREGKRRGRIPISKAYIALFICLTTKAVHLELVSQLTTEAFLAALHRFTARRGICNHIWSDNATNFVGANEKLKDIYKFVSENQNEIITDLAKQNTSWKFIPPRSPHFGGLWESTIKSMKRHFYKVTQNLILTFEECYTLLTGIEACLNSRPLTSISSNPLDLVALTPAHFLIGDSLLQPVERDLLQTPENRLSTWQHLQRIRQHFWKRWSREYLHQLQTRTKWIYNSKNLGVGAMVLVIDDNLPPLKWILGRITAIHPGQDGVVRVVSVQTGSGILKRSVRKLCELPISDNLPDK